MDWVDLADAAALFARVGLPAPGRAPLMPLDHQVARKLPALTGPGNVTPGAEANIMQDPEAADAILRSGVETTMIGLDVTHQAVLTRRDIERWRRLGTPAGDFLAGMTDFYIDAY